MKIIEVVSVAVRIFGILLLVITLRDSPQWLAAMSNLGEQSSSYPHPYIQYATVISYLLISAFMIKFPGVISRLLVTPSASDSPLIEESGEAIQIAGITIVGVYILTWAIPDLLHNGLMLWLVSGYDVPPEDYMRETTISEVITVLEIAIGLYLSLGAKGLARAINKLRA